MTYSITWGATPVPMAFWASQWYRPWSRSRTPRSTRMGPVPAAAPSLYQRKAVMGGWLLFTTQLRDSVSPGRTWVVGGSRDTSVPLGASVGGQRWGGDGGTQKGAVGWAGVRQVGAVLGQGQGGERR